MVLLVIGMYQVNLQKLLCRRSVVLAVIKPEQPLVMQAAAVGITAVGVLVAKQQKRR